MKKLISITLTSLLLCFSIAACADSADQPLLAEQLQPGDTVGLVTLASKLVNAQTKQFDEGLIEKAKQRMTDLGLKSVVGKAAYINRVEDGHHPGTKYERADDFNQMIKDPNIKAIFLLRGGYGCAEVLDLIDYEAIKENPKIIMGFSDSVTLLTAITVKTGLITFHGPMPTTDVSWNALALDNLHDILFDAKEITFANPADMPVKVIQEGTAVGKLFGGNLVTLESIIGTEYMHAGEGTILFFDEMNELKFRIERSLDHFNNARILNKISGLVFGVCFNCNSGGTPDAREIPDIIKERLAPETPAYYGAPIGFVNPSFLLPIGAKVEMDAANATIKMLEPVVKKRVASDLDEDKKDEL